MTSALIPAPSVKTLPLPLDGDLVIDFRNRDPDNASAYLDYPAGVVGKFTIYTDLKTPGATRVSVTATFGSVGTSSGGGSGTTCNIPVPSGVAADHIILVFLYVETTQAVTPASGFTEAPDSPVVVTGSQAHNLRVYWKRATGADSGSYGFTIAAGLAWRMGVAVRFTGCVTSGNPFDIAAAAIKTTTSDGTTPAVSDMTRGDGRMWVWSGSFWNGDVTCTAPSGFTERAEIQGGVVIDVATKDQAVQGESGSVTGTFGGNGATGAWMGALLPINPSTPQGFLAACR